MISMVGIIMSVIGAIFTLWEWVRPYGGHKFNHERDQMIHGIDPTIDGALPVETDEYKSWKKKRHDLIIFGLSLIVIGGLLQLADYIIYIVEIYIS